MSNFTVVNCTPGMDGLEKDFAEKLTLEDVKKRKATKSNVKSNTKSNVKSNTKNIKTRKDGKNSQSKGSNEKKKAPKKVITREEVLALVDERSYKAQEKLCLNDVTPEELKEIGKLILPEHYDEVIEDRVVSHKCGYPCCSNKIGEKKQTGKYYFSLTKVYDISHVGDFCSKECNLASRIFRNSIENVPLLMRIGYKDIADLINNGSKEDIEEAEGKKKETKKTDDTASFGTEAVIEHEIDDDGIAVGGVDESKIRKSMENGDKPLLYTNLNPNSIEGYDSPAFRNAKISVPGTSCDLTSKANYNMFGFEYDDDDDDYDDDDDFDFEEGFGDDDDDDDDTFIDEEEENNDKNNGEEEEEERALSEKYKFMKLSEEGWVTFFLREWKTDYTNMEIRKLEMPLEAKEIGSTMVVQDDEDSRSRKEAFAYMIDTRYNMLADRFDLPFTYLRNGVYGILNTFMFRDQIPAFSEKQMVMFCLVLAEIVRTRVLDRDDPVLSGATLVASRKAMEAFKIPNNKINEIIVCFL